MHALDDAVVARRRETHDAAHADGAVAHHGLLERRRHGQCDGRRRIDDGLEVFHVEHPEVGEGEGGVPPLGGGELAGAGLVHQLAGALGDGLQREVLRVAHDGHGQAVVGVHGHADVDALPDDHLAAVVAAIHLGVHLHRLHTRSHDEVGDGGSELLLHFGLAFEKGRHIDGAGDVEVRDHVFRGGDDAGLRLEAEGRVLHGGLVFGHLEGRQLLVR